jgi:hypothetical protein
MVRINVGKYASLLAIWCALPGFAQRTAGITSAAVHQLVNFNGVAADAKGEPVTGAVGVFL